MLKLGPKKVHLFKLNEKRKNWEWEKKTKKVRLIEFRTFCASGYLLQAKWVKMREERITVHRDAYPGSKYINTHWSLLRNIGTIVNWIQQVSPIRFATAAVTSILHQRVQLVICNPHIYILQMQISAFDNMNINITIGNAQICARDKTSFKCYFYS